jgi:hypothetical protein
LLRIFEVDRPHQSASLLPPDRIVSSEPYVIDQLNPHRSYAVGL